MKAILVKHAFREMWDVRVEIVPDIFDVEQYKKELLGNFEVIAVTERIYTKGGITLLAPRNQAGVQTNED